MHPIVQKTLGGLSAQYYLRQLFFGLLLAGIIFFMSTQGERSMPIGLIFLTVINTLLYPYSRFVYEGMVGFIMGKNVFFVNAVLMLFTKFITMTICWSFAIFIAPVGLVYLYYHHSKSER
ncbi:MAG: hypothetical protein A2063_03650 [Gallionellales bacterium GWA2_60_142]|jgi:hypothetical protein|nr:MAG: hypothetical protein A2063_03650 [Gallionellales bacterium GWA2_60_142]HCI14032.1 hypothetical protein [Gallionellaceae bacterium]